MAKVVAFYNTSSRDRGQVKKIEGLSDKLVPRIYGGFEETRYSGVGLNVTWPDINNHATLSLV